MEMIFLMVWKRRQDIEFQKSRATLQALLSQKGAADKEILKAFEDLKDAFFPYDKNQKSDEIKKMREAMQKELKRGPLEISVIRDPDHKKTEAKLAKGQEVLRQGEALRREGRLQPMDPFDRARRRKRTAS
jgi:DNA modification methylase